MDEDHDSLRRQVLAGLLASVPVGLATVAIAGGSLNHPRPEPAGNTWFCIRQDGAARRAGWIAQRSSSAPRTGAPNAAPGPPRGCRDMNARSGAIHNRSDAQAARRRYWNIVVPLLVLAAENDERRRRLDEARRQWPGPPDTSTPTCMHPIAEAPGRDRTLT